MIQIIEGNIVFPNKIEYGQLIIEDQKISEIILNKSEFRNADIIAKENEFISAGFIDLQINGAFGKEFKTDEDAIQVVSNEIYKFGTTSFCPTVTTSDINKYPSFTASLINNYKFAGQTKLIGLHLEGPMLNPQKVGAQNATLLKTPKEIDIDKYVNPNVKIVTFSPELEGSENFIEELKKRNIKIGFGHSTITYEQVTKIFDANNMMIVHLFNAMDGLGSREPGLAGAGMANDYYFSIIPDGIHLHNKTMEIVWNSKQNKNKLLSISDGSAVTGLEIGTYNIGERVITKSETKATLPNGTLVGSILTLNNAVKNLMVLCGATLYEAINTVSLNPSSYLGLENEIGQIKIGNFADILIFDENIKISKTFINGKLIYSTNE